METVKGTAMAMAMAMATRVLPPLELKTPGFDVLQAAPQLLRQL